MEVGISRAMSMMWGLLHWHQIFCVELCAQFYDQVSMGFLLRCHVWWRVDHQIFWTTLLHPQKIGVHCAVCCKHVVRPIIFEITIEPFYSGGEVDKNVFHKTHVWSCLMLVLGNKKENAMILLLEKVARFIYSWSPLLVQTNSSQHSEITANKRTMLRPCCINSPFLQKPVRKMYASQSIWQSSHTKQ